MANQEHLDILRQGVEVWNSWRGKHPNEWPGLSSADLRGADLRGINLNSAILSNANLIGTNLIGANLSGADLSRANLNGANLSGVSLSGARLSRADLSGANLSRADLSRAILSHTDLNSTILTHAITGYTLFVSVDLQTVNRLETVRHHGPSSIGIDTIYRSGGNIPEAFLRGAGAPDIFIEYMRSLVGKPIEFYSCFISYSSKNQEFAQRLHNDLQGNGVRCWYAPEDLKIGDKFRVRIDESIRLYDKLLLVLSEHSVKSPWVETEVETAFSKEHKTGKLALFPVRLDNAVVETEQAWPATIQRTRHIGDFTHWKEHDEYQKGLTRLLRDLKQDAIHDKL